MDEADKLYCPNGTSIIVERRKAGKQSVKGHMVRRTIKKNKAGKQGVLRGWQFLTGHIFLF